LQKDPFNHRVYQQQWKLNCQDSGLLVTSYPGVFAHGRLDAGTALLLEALAAMQIEGDVLDFACGAGVIGTCVAAKHPNSKVTLLDSSALALMATEETLATNQLTASVLPSDGLSQVQARYDFIVSNPPIHAGVKTDNLLSHRLLASVQNHISPGGQLIMVANRHLPYEKWLLDQFRYCEELLSNSQFKVIAAHSNS
jgi:16S rRNA (guanine1207-N2)-methyltransferase